MLYCNENKKSENELKLYFDSLLNFAKLGLTVDSEKKDDCFKTILFLEKHLRDITSKKLNINLKTSIPLIDFYKKEIILILEENNINRNFLIDFMDNSNLNYYFFSSIYEYNEISSEMKKDKIILISNKIYELFGDEITDCNNIILVKLQQSYKNGNIAFISANTGTEMKLFKDEVESNINKYSYLNALIITDNPVKLKVLTQILKFLNVEYNAVKTVSNALELIKENTFNVIFFDITTQNSIDTLLINNIKEITSKNTIKICISSIPSNDIKNTYIEAGVNEFCENFYDIKYIDNIFFKYFSENSESKMHEIIVKKNRTEYYKMFLTHLSENLLKLKETSNNKEFEEIRKLVHNLKSGAGTLKEIKILSLLHRIDDSAVKKNIKMLNKCFYEIKLEKERLEEMYL